MNLTWTAEERRFRDEVRAFMQDHLPHALRNKTLNHQRISRADYVAWHRILAAQGWGAPGWPVQYGGTGWTSLQRLIFEIEGFKAGAPRLLPFGLSMLGPVLMRFGSDEQKSRLLPRIINMDDWWCQGYSEPGAGSDLASLKTRAERDGDEYVVTGQKTWTTLAHEADWIFCLVRTDMSAKPQRGISLLLIDMRSQGVSVRPIRTLDGSHEINEVWLDRVRVPVANLVGEENQGWTYAKYLLGHERTNIAGLGHCYRELAFVKALAARTPDGDLMMLDHADIRAAIVRIESAIMALEMSLLRVAAAGDSQQGPQASILKIRGSEIQQDLATLQMQILGPDAWAYDPAWMEDGDLHEAAAITATYFDLRKTTIYGGTTEIQKNLIARMALGS